ncbi:MAG TPA: tetratricopeptide repeat protein [Lacunisphaera sp.]|nr:tetratricopeptide repeat protein [Lacunisphaera sp.]
MKKSPPAAEYSRSTSWIAAALLALLGLVAYHNSFRVPFLFDDYPAIVNNPGLRPPYSAAALLWPRVEGGATVVGRPVANVSFAINYLAGGLRVEGYHYVNLGLHIAAGCLLFGIVRRLHREPKAAAWVGFWSSALWLTHPLQTESVTYIVQRTEALAGLWCLLAVYGFLRAGAAASSGIWLRVSVAASFLGMATKETAAVTPLLVLLIDRTWGAGSFSEAWRRRRTYYLALAATWGVLAVLLVLGEGRGGTAGFGTGIPVWNYMLTQCQGIVLYLARTVWPVGLVFDYGTGTVGGFSQAAVQAIAVMTLVGGTVWTLVRRPAWGCLGAVFLLLLAPTSSVVPVASQTLAEHRMYLAVAIPLLLMVIGLWRALERRAIWVLASIVIASTSLTIRRNADYANDLTLWADTVAKRPANSRAWHNLGIANLDRGRLDEAERCLRQAIALVPAEAEPHFSLGVVLTRQGRRDEAAASLAEAVRLDSRQIDARINLANLLASGGRMDEAARLYEEALRLRPTSGPARAGLASLLVAQGRAAEALAQCEEAIRLQPELAVAYLNAGNACRALGRREDAARYYEETLRRDTGSAEAHLNLGNLRIEAGDLAGAIGHLEMAVQAKPDNFVARRTLALVLLNQGRAADAVPHLEELARQAPGDRELANVLAEARAMARR